MKIIDAILKLFNRIGDKWLLMTVFMMIFWRYDPSSPSDFLEKMLFAVSGALMNMLVQNRNNRQQFSAGTVKTDTVNVTETRDKGE